MILVIQTVRPEIEVMLFDHTVNLVAERNWLSAKDEVSRLLPEIEKLIVLNGGWEKISKIVVFNGIGGFTSTRIGVTVANTLAMVAKVELYKISLPEDHVESETVVLIKKFFAENPLPVKIAQPKYKSSPRISTSKKKKFN